MDVQLAFLRQMFNLVMIMFYLKRVYAVSMAIGAENKIYRGVANVGVKPTFHHPSKAEVVIEVNIFDFNDNIYGERVIVYWHHYLRPEVKFDGIDPLVEQMNNDKEKRNTYFQLISVMMYRIIFKVEF